MPLRELMQFLFHKFGRKAASFILLNFGAPLAFFITFQIAGPKPAIALAVISTFLQGIAHWLFSMPMSPFYLIASGFTVGFGCIDLWIATPRIYRLEPFAQNMIIGLVFLLSLFTRISVLSWLAGGLPAAFRPKISPEMTGYLRRLTLIWGIYFIAKAILFLYLALTVNLGQLILLRAIIGGVSLALMVGAEIIYRKFWLEKHWEQKPPSDVPPHSEQSV